MEKFRTIYIVSDDPRVIVEFSRVNRIKNKGINVLYVRIVH
jgi:hypothetical protein